MEEEKIQELAEKVKNGSATPQEELEFLKILNNGVKDLRSFIKEEMADK